MTIHQPTRREVLGGLAGVHTLVSAVILRKKGKQTLTATDTLNSALTATDTISVV